MKSSKRYVSILAVLFAISISLAGCSQNAIAPTQNDLNQQKLDWLNQFMGPEGAQRGSLPLDSCPVLFDTVMTDWVGYLGDQFTMQNGAERIDFKVPKAALYIYIKLTLHVTKYQAPFGSFWLLDCGPNGTVFAKPLEVNPNKEITDNNSSVLFYFNPDSGQWEIQEIAPVGSDLRINHFSKYGIS